MPSPPRLPEPPHIHLELLQDRTDEARATGGFLNLRRVDLVARYPDGSRSRSFPYDLCERVLLDAVIVVAHFEQEGRRHVYLRSTVRPPITLRRGVLPEADGGRVWEVVAGLIDPGETPREAAARELAEELGVVMPPEALQDLGPHAYPAPAVIGERHDFFHVEIEPTSRGVPSEDGSPLEHGAAIVAIPLDDALALARAGKLPDAKTELALRRLKEVLP